MKKNGSVKRGSAIAMGLSLMALTACNEIGTWVTPASGVERGSLEDGNAWTATLSPLNERFGSGSGKASFKIEGGKLIAEIETSGLKESAHIQTIRSGACPVESSDLNTDGFIDALESGATPENAILSLDGDLSTEEAGAEAYPVSDVTGSYLYSQSTDQTILGDQDLIGKIVLIHGIPESETLPETVKGLGTDNQHETMPILCGTIMKDELSPPDEELPPPQNQHQQQQQHQQQEQQTMIE